MKHFGGSILFLDRGDINTDEIIPAKYLNENSKQALKDPLFEDLHLSGFDPARDIPGKQAVVSRSNFGCGSSREHAPWALEANGINIVIAESFARIFRQNMYNCGMLALELPASGIDELFRNYRGKEANLSVDIEKSVLIFTSSQADIITLPFSLNGFEKALVEAGGWVEYATVHY